MSREIKFRAWFERLNLMIPDVPVWKNMHYHISDNPIMGYDFSECVLMQYTGLKDINGVEIYEGDIRQNGDTLVYSNAWCRYGWKGGGYFLDILLSSDEVIGNIYENPELLLNQNQ